MGANIFDALKSPAATAMDDTSPSEVLWGFLSGHEPANVWESPEVKLSTKETLEKKWTQKGGGFIEWVANSLCTTRKR